MGSTFQRVSGPLSCRYENATNQYMVILKFDSQEHADDFYLSYNGKQFSSLEVRFDPLSSVTCKKWRVRLSTNVGSRRRRPRVV